MTSVGKLHVKEALKWLDEEISLRRAVRLSWLRRAHRAQEPVLNRGQQLLPREECKTGSVVNDRSPDFTSWEMGRPEKADTSPCTPPKPDRCPADCHQHITHDATPWSGLFCNFSGSFSPYQRPKIPKQQQLIKLKARLPQPCYSLSTLTRNCRAPRNEGVRQGLCRTRSQQFWLCFNWIAILKSRSNMLSGDLHSSAKFPISVWVDFLEQQPPLQQLQVKLNPRDSYPAKCEQ